MWRHADWSTLCLVVCYVLAAFQVYIIYVMNFFSLLMRWLEAVLDNVTETVVMRRPKASQGGMNDADEFRCNQASVQN